MMRKIFGSEKIGVFGGTFDPPHHGHLAIARRACSQLKLDRVVFVPAFRAPHKRNRKATPARVRLAMTEAATRNDRRISVSDIEIELKGVSYTIRTLRALRKRFPNAKFFLIVGGDSYRDMATWKSPHEIRALANIVVYPRSLLPQNFPRTRSKSIVILKGRPLEISSTEVRDRVRRREPITHLVPRSVEQMIRKKKLYVDDGD